MKDYKEIAELAMDSVLDMDDRMSVIDKDAEFRKEEAFEKCKREVKVVAKDMTKGDFIEMLDRCDFDDDRVLAMVAICIAESSPWVDDKQKKSLHDFAYSLLTKNDY